MKILFAHDSRFVKFNDIYYANGHYAYDLQWKRYLEYVDEIRVAGRTRECSDLSKLDLVSISSGPGVSFVECPNLVSVNGILHISETVRMLKEEIRNADAVVARMPSAIGSLAAHIAKREKIPYLVEVVGCSRSAFWYYGTLTGKLVALPAYLLERHIVKKAPFAVYVSRNFLQKRYPNRNYNVGCPDCCVEMTDISVLDKRLERIEAYDKDTIYRLGFVGTAKIKYKGLETAIKALSVLSESGYRNFKLCILGSGDYSGWMKLAKEYHVEDMIELCGIIPGGQAVFEWFDDIDIFVMPSFQETLGRALVEAMSRGCPAFGSRETAIPEQLGDDCIFSMKDYKKLAGLIMNMCDNKDYMKLCAKENFYRAQKYSEEILKPQRKKYWNDFIEYIRQSGKR